MGYVLPLQRGSQGGEKVWESGLWLLRGKHLVLIPGDSPIGLRLPMSSLPWVAATEYPYLHPQDPIAQYPKLPVPRRIPPLVRATGRDCRWQRFRRTGQCSQSLRDRMPEVGAIRKLGRANGAVRRAARRPAARFLPPVTVTEDYLDLIAAIEDTAAALDMPVIVEGEPPPYDPRLGVLKVTPDPGVIEVNVQPAQIGRN